MSDKGELLRRTLTGILIIILSVILLPACSLDSREDQPEGTVTLVTSIYPVYVFTLNLIDGVEGVTVTNMVAPDTGCLHEYQLLPGDMRILERADGFIINGAGMEGFMDKVTAQLPELEVIDAGQGIDLLADEAHAHEEESDEHVKAANAHVWLAIPNAMAQVSNIADGLCALDPGHEQQYRDNEKQYIKRLETLHAELAEGCAVLRAEPIVTFHEAFPYFAREYGLDVAAVMELEPGSAPDTQELAHLIDIIRQQEVRVLFVEPQYSQQVAQTIARETGAQIFMLDPVVTGEPDNILTYENAMRKNLSVLEEALGQ